MKKSLIIFACFIVSSVFAQLDKIYPDMPEHEFLLKFPTAYRDWEMEALKIDEPEPSFATNGSGSWKLMHDTIRQYYFKSRPVYGPSVEFPKADSTKVHKMKVELDQLKVDLEKVLGAPGEYHNYKLISFPGPEKEQYCYLATWNVNGSPVVLSIARDYQMDGVAKSKRDPTPAEVYTMEVLIEGVNTYLTAKYAVGLTGAAFRQRYPDLADETIEEDMPAYAMPDPAFPEAQWEFDFENGKMWAAYYLADYGMRHGAKSTDEAYLKMKAKAIQLLDEGTRKYGQPDSVSDNISTAYVARRSELEPARNYLYAEWEGINYSLILIFEEASGGRDEDIYFTIEVEMIVDP